MTRPEQIAVLVTGGTGTVGSRVTAQHRQRGLRARPVARSSESPFDWSEPITWPAARTGADAVFVLLPEDRALDPDFLTAALASGGWRVVLLSDRGVDLMPVERLQRAEELVRQLSVPWRILRPDWFDQDFETFFRQPVLDGVSCTFRWATCGRASSTPTTSRLQRAPRSPERSTSHWN